MRDQPEHALHGGRTTSFPLQAPEATYVFGLWGCGLPAGRYVLAGQWPAPGVLSAACGCMPRACAVTRAAGSRIEHRVEVLELSPGVLVCPGWSTEPLALPALPGRVSVISDAVAQSHSDRSRSARPVALADIAQRCALCHWAPVRSSQRRLADYAVVLALQSQSRTLNTPNKQRSGELSAPAHSCTGASLLRLACALVHGELV